VSSPSSDVVALLPSWLDAQQIIESLGGFALGGSALIIFAECGLLIGFFFPGDSLLFAVGLLISTGTMDTPLWLACVVLTLAAVVGNLCGYWVGRKAGPAVFRRPDSRLFRRDHVDRTHAFFEKYGARAIVLARFVPIVRTFITVMAGVGRMDFRSYATYSTIGGILWGTGVTIAGFYLGKVDFIANNVEALAIVIVLLSVIPIVAEIARGRRSTQTPDDTTAS
jgi:membrane-associated protein